MTADLACKAGRLHTKNGSLLQRALGFAQALLALAPKITLSGDTWALPEGPDTKL